MIIFMTVARLLDTLSNSSKLSLPSWFLSPAFIMAFQIAISLFSLWKSLKICSHTHWMIFFKIIFCYIQWKFVMIEIMSLILGCFFLITLHLLIFLLYCIYSMLLFSLCKSPKSWTYLGFDFDPTVNSNQKVIFHRRKYFPFIFWFLYFPITYLTA